MVFSYVIYLFHPHARQCAIGDGSLIVGWKYGFPTGIRKRGNNLFTSFLYLFARKGREKRKVSTYISWPAKLYKLLNWEAVVFGRHKNKLLAILLMHVESEHVLTVLQSSPLQPWVVHVSARLKETTTRNDSWHWGQGVIYPLGTCWTHCGHRQQVTPMCPVGKNWVHWKCTHKCGFNLLLGEILIAFWMYPVMLPQYT